jgi:hypothetical protein
MPQASRGTLGESRLGVQIPGQSPDDVRVIIP